MELHSVTFCTLVHVLLATFSVLVCVCTVCMQRLVQSCCVCCNLVVQTLRVRNRLGELSPTRGTTGSRTVTEWTGQEVGD